MSPHHFFRGLWRLSQPFRFARGRKFLRLPGLMAQFAADYRQFQRLGGDGEFQFLAPSLFDRDPSTQTGGGHYFFQDIWALRRLAEFKPDVHHDVGSRLDGFVGQATSICPVVFYDIRPPSFVLPQFEYCRGSALEMLVQGQSLRSLSCLHTAEHIGLGRYGDPLDPDGTSKTLSELMRILAPGGQLLFSMPVGQQRTEFNAQRIWHPQRPIDTVPELVCKEFSAVNDRGEFLRNIDPSTVAGEKYACGMYLFTRP